MKKIKSNGVSALGTTPIYASQLNTVLEALGVNNDGATIPENVYPVADGEGGFLAGDIQKIEGGIYGNNWKIGNNALADITTGGSNISIGTSSLSSLTTGYQNVVIGNSSGASVTTSTNNVFLGNASGSSFIIGGNNVIIGAEAGSSNQIDVSASIAIGGEAYTTKDLQAVFGSNSITETYLRGMLINTRRYTPIDVTTNPITADAVLYGVITCNNGSAMTLTLPTSTLLMAALNNGASTGTTFDMYVYNIGAGTVTIAMGTGITVHTPVTGAASEIMTVSQANAVGCFRFFCTSPTLNSETFKIMRVF